MHLNEYINLMFLVRKIEIEIEIDNVQRSWYTLLLQCTRVRRFIGTSVHTSSFNMLLYALLPFFFIAFVIKIQIKIIDCPNLELWTPKFRVFQLQGNFDYKISIKRIKLRSIKIENDNDNDTDNPVIVKPSHRW